MKVRIGIRGVLWASDGIGSSADGTPRRHGAAGWSGALLPLVVAFAGICSSCSPDMKDGLGPRVPAVNVEGEVLRDGNPAARLSVSIRNPVDSRSVASARTGNDGAYAVAAPEGAWEIKVSGGRTGDFDSVTREFSLADADRVVTIPAIDVATRGAGASSPADSSVVSLAPGDSLHFAWSGPSPPALSARIQIYDASGAPVWYADKTTGGAQAWDGIGNQGSYAARPAPAGDYSWRVKFTLADSSEARLAFRSLRLR